MGNYFLDIQYIQDHLHWASTRRSPRCSTWQHCVAGSSLQPGSGYFRPGDPVISDQGIRLFPSRGTGNFRKGIRLFPEEDPVISGQGNRLLTVMESGYLRSGDPVISEQGIRGVFTVRRSGYFRPGYPVIPGRINPFFRPARGSGYLRSGDPVNSGQGIRSFPARGSGYFRPARGSGYLRSGEPVISGQGIRLFTFRGSGHFSAKWIRSLLSRGFGISRQTTHWVQMNSGCSISSCVRRDPRLCPW